jgi:hypothetical protein
MGALEPQNDYPACNVGNKLNNDRNQNRHCHRCSVMRSRSIFLFRPKGVVR